MSSVHRNCPNKEAGPCNWRSPNNNNITTEAETQELTKLHFTVGQTNPNVMQRKLERREQEEHNHRMDLAADTRANKAQKNPADQNKVDHIHPPEEPNMLRIDMEEIVVHLILEKFWVAEAF